ncbi:MAG: ATP cone domain-containing protein [Patescibacteria group bacterium]|nr:ATP cone domain-containing protein [Patescibacteria group bacterium]
MVVSIIKRDGRLEDFDIQKLKKSIENAALDAGYEEDKIFQIIEDISSYVLESVNDLDRVDSQSLRELILSKLDKDYPQIAKAWRDYDVYIKGGKD